MRRPDRNRQRYQGWVEQHGEELYRLAYRLCGQKEQAEDLVQETFYHAWRSMGSLRDEHRARAWLFRILRHRYSHQVRTASRRPRANTPLDSAPEHSDPGPQPPVEVMAREESLQLALDGLDERYRLPLLMVFMEGLTCREAAEELEVPLGTVLSRIHRARRSMRQSLEKQETEAETPPSEQARQQPQLRLRGEGA